MLTAWTDDPAKLRADILASVRKGAGAKTGGAIDTWEIGANDVLIHSPDQRKPEGGFNLVPDTAGADKASHCLEFNFTSFKTAVKTDRVATKRYLEGRLLELLLVHFDQSFRFISAK